MKNDEIIEILKEFNIHDIDISSEPIYHGYINDTFIIRVASKPKYILQRINPAVFPSPEEIQYNIDKASSKLQDINYTAVHFLKTKKQLTLLHLNDQVFRLMKFIDGSQVYDTTHDETIAFEAGRIIGSFHKMMETEKLDDYKITLPDFHNLKSRVNQFNLVLDSPSVINHKADNEIEFVLQTIPLFDDFLKADLPLRLCHNDTKLNNILFDIDNKALCLIDLDTVMPGHFYYDFGDAVRTIVNPADEDEKNLTQIKFSMKLFEAFIDGIIASKLKLSENEIEFLPLAAALMPFLHGLRMLTDYLQGNVYYKVSYPDQNLDRCRSLFHFTALALEFEDEMRTITKRLK